MKTDILNEGTKIVFEVTKKLTTEFSNKDSYSPWYHVTVESMAEKRSVDGAEGVIPTYQFRQLRFIVASQEKLKKRARPVVLYNVAELLAVYGF